MVAEDGNERLSIYAQINSSVISSIITSQPTNWQKNINP